MIYHAYLYTYMTGVSASAGNIVLTNGIVDDSFFGDDKKHEPDQKTYKHLVKQYELAKMRKNKVEMRRIENQLNWI